MSGALRFVAALGIVVSLSLSSDCGAAPQRAIVTSSTHARDAEKDVLISRIKAIAERDVRPEVDERCPLGNVYVRRVYGDGDTAVGGTLAFYGAEECGWYQVYRVSGGRIEPAGVDVFGAWATERGDVQIGFRLPHSNRVPAAHEVFALIGPLGVLCRASIASDAEKGPWTLDGCRNVLAGVVPRLPGDQGGTGYLDAQHLSKRESVVAVRGSDVTDRAALRLDDELLPPSMSDGTWKPTTVVDLVGDQSVRVEIQCRHPGTPETECERSMVYLDKACPPLFVPVSRVRWWPRRAP